jgi:hypothetical protein
VFRAGMFAVALVAAAGCGSSSPHTEATSVVRSRVYGYQLTRPAGWSAVLADHMLSKGENPVTGLAVTDIVARRASRRFHQLVQPALVIGAQRLASGSTLQGWDDAVESLVGRFKGCPQPTSRSNTEVGGIAALELLYRDCPAGSGLYHVWTILVRRGLGYQLVWFDAARHENQDRALLRRLLGSLSFQT